MALSAINFPLFIIRALQALYSNNHHYFQFAGLVMFAFTGGAGVRQGCPASSSLFVVVTDPIVRALLLRIPRNCMLRAYADDIALVLTNFWLQAPAVALMFHEI
eukprot:8295167-Heterocapsa_arctica.AAC.1